MTGIDTTDAAAFSPAAIKPRVSIGDLDKLDIRVGTRGSKTCQNPTNLCS
jgi:hypothetical protein